MLFQSISSIVGFTEVFSSFKASVGASEFFHRHRTPDEQRMTRQSFNSNMEYQHYINITYLLSCWIAYERSRFIEVLIQRLMLLNMNSLICF